jgi:hypothetical protein
MRAELDLRYEAFKLLSLRKEKPLHRAATSYAPSLECGYGRVVEVLFLIIIQE